MIEEAKNQELSSGIECPNCGALGVQTRFVNDKFNYTIEGTEVTIHD